MKKFSQENNMLSGNEIRTKRFTLKPLSLDDEYGFYLMRSCADTMRFISLDPITDHAAHVVDFKTEMHNNYEHRGKFLYGIHIEGDDHMIGIVILRPLTTGEAIEIGYWVRKDYWGCGYASEAQVALMDAEMASLGCSHQDLIAYVEVGNVASRRVQEKIGLCVHETGLIEDINCWIFQWGEKPA